MLIFVDVKLKLNVMKTELSKKQIKEAPDFKPVVDYEGLYEVGKDGSVWSLNYRHTGQRKQLRATPHNKYGHLTVFLCKDGKKKTHLRLTGEKVRKARFLCFTVRSNLQG